MKLDVFRRTGRRRKEGVKRSASGKSRGDNLDENLKAANAAKRYRHDLRCCLYAIVPMPMNWPTKIGVARNPGERLATLQTSHWDKLELAAVGFCTNDAMAFAVEAKAGALLKEAGVRIRGEWFDIGSERAFDAVRLAAVSLGVDFTEVPRGSY